MHGQCANILFNLKLTLAKGNFFFFPPSSLGDCGLTATCGGGVGEEFKTE